MAYNCCSTDKNRMACSLLVVFCYITHGSNQKAKPHFPKPYKK